METNRTNNPLVSLITPGWNGVSFVYRLLDSILQQTYTNIEFIYVDDGSTDGTKNVVQSYQKKFEERGILFTYIYKENGGVSSAINVGLKYVNGEFLCWPEYDDILTPDSIEKKVNSLIMHPDCAVVTSDAWIIEEHNIKKIIGVLSHNNPNRFDRNHFVQALLTNSIFTAACHMIRMNMFDQVNPRREIYPSKIGPNWQMLLPLYYKYNRNFIEKPLLYYLIRNDSISHSHNTLKKQAEAINEYIKILKYVLKQIEMPQSDFELYNRLIDEKYAFDRMNLGLRYHDKALFYRGYDYFKDKIVPLKAEKLKKIFQHTLYRFAYMVFRKFVFLLRK